jgi:hypothetical protein
VIKPASALPPIKGPVQIEGAAWKRTGDFIAVDGIAFRSHPPTCRAWADGITASAAAKLQSCIEGARFSRPAN